MDYRIRAMPLGGESSIIQDSKSKYWMVPATGVEDLYEVTAEAADEAVQKYSWLALDVPFNTWDQHEDIKNSAAVEISATYDVDMGSFTLEDAERFIQFALEEIQDDWREALDILIDLWLNAPVVKRHEPCASRVKALMTDLLFDQSDEVVPVRSTQRLGPRSREHIRAKERMVLA
ncbi:hypothetical protein C5C44_02570 [Rathayibacter sp. AY1F6]|uniref:hypothetical protein n=1 Tax=Rathayibacter sp. AY1F6 TaxID=2080560 RepID=UPI000CE811A0|nr:hypothetical protein [Rathayibacter sp. AY1F6]PPH05635.1 hypothetical protein C5C44_02570 [Rathayibacter sp. AY1F6]